MLLMTRMNKEDVVMRRYKAGESRGIADSGRDRRGGMH
jgi:hypothetical protein